MDCTGWVQNTSPASVMRIDPGTGRVATVVGTRPVPYGSFVVGWIAIGYGSLWTVADDFLTRIDPRTSQVQARIRIPRVQDIAIPPVKSGFSPAPDHATRPSTTRSSTPPRSGKSTPAAAGSSRNRSV